MQTEATNRTDDTDNLSDRQVCDAGDRQVSSDCHLVDCLPAYMCWLYVQCLITKGHLLNGDCCVFYFPLLWAWFISVNKAIYCLK